MFIDRHELANNSFLNFRQIKYIAIPQRHGRGRGIALPTHMQTAPDTDDVFAIFRELNGPSSLLELDSDRAGTLFRPLVSESRRDPLPPPPGSPRSLTKSSTGACATGGVSRASSSESDEFDLHDFEFVVLPTGEVHTCAGIRCPHVQETDDGSLVCGVSGHVLAGAAETSVSETGFREQAVHPDMRSGGLSWKKRSAFNESKRAFCLAGALDTSQDFAPQQHHETPRRRGARCVNEPAVEPRAPRVSTGRTDQLVIDAKGVFARIVRQRDDSTAAAFQDSRLYDPKYVTTMALANYCTRLQQGMPFRHNARRRCVDTSGPPG